MDDYTFTDNGWDYGPGNVDDYTFDSSSLGEYGPSAELSNDFVGPPSFLQDTNFGQDNAWDFGPGNVEQWEQTGTGDYISPNAGGFMTGQGQYQSYQNLGQQTPVGGVQGYLSQLFANPQNITKMLGAVQEMYANKKKANALGRIANQQMQQMDPFGSQRAQYQQLLQQTYADPNVVLNRPEIRAQLAQMRKTLEARDAAAGRRSQYGNREVQLAQESAKLVDDYRKQLSQLSGSQFAPQTAQAAQMAAQGATTNAQGLAPVFNAVSNIQQQQTLADLLNKWQR